MSFRLGKLGTRIYFILFAGICQENFKRVQFKAVLHIQVRRTWITGPARFSIDIQVLTDLKRLLSREALHHPENPIILKILIQKEKGAMHGEGQALALRWKEFVRPTVARGPVPRECSTGIRLSMHGERQVLALRLSGR